ncbi:SOUL heme-binding protein [bacterium 336/3]|nr:SOUL heme-binding protein [bacterium 336/3]
MKTAIIIISIIVVLIIISQIYILMSTQKSETQPYKVIREEEKFEIRHYPSATMAMITSNTKSYKELGNSGFRKLAGYIFGGNKDSKQISMTSPVHMEINDSVSSMSFVMPSNYHKDNLPLPNDTEVIIKTSPEEYVAAIRFGGFASEEDIQKHKIILERSLKENKLSYYGSFRYLGYNPPYQLLGRRNEIIVSLNWDGK